MSNAPYTAPILAYGEGEESLGVDENVETLNFAVSEGLNTVHLV